MKVIQVLPALALGFLLAASASAQHHGVPKVDYDPEPGGGDPTAPPGCAGVNARVTITGGTSFIAGDVTVNAGQPVCWTWSGTSFPHNVKADDDSFTSGPPSNSGNFQRTFNTPGTYGYYCQVHGSLTGGMRGTITVLEGVPEACGDGKGSLQLDPAGYTVNESGIATVSVARVGGGTGPASVRISTVPGSAKAGKDYLPRNNVLLSWDDGDCGLKTLDVQTKDDSAVEPDETFNVKLLKATGATLGSPITAAVTIHDDDGCTTALAPITVKAAGLSSSEIRVAWTDEGAAAGSIHLERRQEGGAFREVALVPEGDGSFVDSDLPRGTSFQYRLRVEGLDGVASYTAIAAAATDGDAGECAHGPHTLCLGDGRFEATAKWRSTEGQPWHEAARAQIDDAPRSGAFSFAPRGDVQLLLNVVDGCRINDRFWVQLAALGDVELAVTVRDTQTGRTWAYFSPAGEAASPVRDVEALPTCP